MDASIWSQSLDPLGDPSWGAPATNVGTRSFWSRFLLRTLAASPATLLGEFFPCGGESRSSQTLWGTPQCLVALTGLQLSRRPQYPRVTSLMNAQRWTQCFVSPDLQISLLKFWSSSLRFTLVCLRRVEELYLCKIFQWAKNWEWMDEWEFI